MDVLPSGLDINRIQVVEHIPVTSEFYIDLWYDFAHYSVVQSLTLSMKEWGTEIGSVLWIKVRMSSSFSPAVSDKRHLTGI